MSTCSFLKYGMFSFFMVSLTFPAFASADGLTSSLTMTTPPVREKQDASNEAPVEFNTDYVKGYGRDFKRMVTSPARWDTSDWITATLVAGAAIGLYENDAKIQKWVLEHKTTTTNNIGDEITDFGHGKFTPVILGGMYLYGYAADDGKMRRTVLLSVESFVLTGVFVQTIKYTTHRHRPNTGDPPHTFDGPSLRGESSNSSCPSGHASSAFAVATVIASEYDNMLVPTVAYGIAAITALNRVSHNAHWSSDAFLGAAIGYFTGKTIVASHRNVKKDDFSLTPVAGDGLTGMILTFRF